MPAAKAEIVVAAVLPATDPGLIVQFPAGKPLRATLPVAAAHVGCVIVPTVGAAGVAGCALITTFADGADVQPDASVTV